MITLILSGGNGSRLWPLSREQYPKQFLSLLTDKTLLQETLLRINSNKNPIIVCNESHRFIVAEQLKKIGVTAESILLEPFGRNTSPAVALTAMMLLKQGRDETLLVLPADHVIQNKTAFHTSLSVAKKEAQKGQLVLFGIKAEKPETGFGYIKCHQLTTETQNAVLSVDSFIEKPDLKKAQSFVEQGNYYWNSGMFAFKCSCYLQELKEHSPDIYEACEQTLQASHYSDQLLHIDAERFKDCPDNSIDYSVMEKTNKAILIPLDSDWNDIGSWSSLWEISDKDKQGNVSFGDVILQDSKNNLALSSKRLVTLLGVENLLVVETSDAILVAHRDNAQSIKELVKQLKRAQRTESATNSLVYRPWGCYETIDYGSRFQVKRITVNPGATLSLQMHHHRAEHWIVVTGTALINCDEKEFILSENESTYIPITSVHRLSNPGCIPLEVIEIQSGSYLGEDDIQRFEDMYGRLENDNTSEFGQMVSNEC